MNVASFSRENISRVAILAKKWDPYQGYRVYGAAILGDGLGFRTPSYARVGEPESRIWEPLLNFILDAFLEIPPNKRGAGCSKLPGGTAVLLNCSACVPTLALPEELPARPFFGSASSKRSTTTQQLAAVGYHQMN